MTAASHFVLKIPDARRMFLNCKISKILGSFIVPGQEIKTYAHSFSFPETITLTHFKTSRVWSAVSSTKFDTAKSKTFHKQTMSLQFVANEIQNQLLEYICPYLVGWVMQMAWLLKVARLCSATTVRQNIWRVFEPTFTLVKVWVALIELKLTACVITERNTSSHVNPESNVLSMCKTMPAVQRYSTFAESLSLQDVWKEVESYQLSVVVAAIIAITFT